MGPKKGTWGVGQLVACLERRVTSVKKSNRILTHFRHPLEWAQEKNPQKVPYLFYLSCYYNI